MGFKFKRFDINVGTSDFPTTTTDASLRSKSEIIIKGVVQCLLDLNIGWQLDTNRSTTITSFTEVPLKNTSVTAPGLFLVNSISGNKLFIAYIGSSKDCYCFDDGGNDAQVFGLRSSSSSDNATLISGLVLSMIPGDAGQDFGASFGADFIPSKATKLIGTVSQRKTATFSNANNLAYRAYNMSLSSNYVASYGVFATEYCIMIGVGLASGGAKPNISPFCAVGRILSDLAHSADTLCTSRYGVIKFCICQGSASAANNEMTPVMGSYVQSILGSDRTIRGTGMNSYNYVTETYSGHSPTPCQIFNAAGNPINNNDSTYISFQALNPYICIANTVTTTSGTQGRWSPFVMFVYTSDLQANGVVSGDGVKGYLDVDLFRLCGNTSYNQRFDNDTWIGMGGWMIVSWDPSNII